MFQDWTQTDSWWMKTVRSFFNIPLFAMAQRMLLILWSFCCCSPMGDGFLPERLSSQQFKVYLLGWETPDVLLVWGFSSMTNNFDGLSRPLPPVFLAAADTADRRVGMLTVMTYFTMYVHFKVAYGWPCGLITCRCWSSRLGSGRQLGIHPGWNWWTVEALCESAKVRKKTSSHEKWAQRVARLLAPLLAERPEGRPVASV